MVARWLQMESSYSMWPIRYLEWILASCNEAARAFRLVPRLQLDSSYVVAKEYREDFNTLL